MLRLLFISLLALTSLQGEPLPIADFSFSFYQSAKPEENAIFSPFSIYTCLAMPYMGSRGNTQAEIEQLLCLSPDKITQSLPSYISLLTSKSENDKSYRFEIANSLWMAQDTPILPAFRKTIENDFQATARTVNFGRADETTNTINSWVSEHTHTKIPHLLSASDVNSNTKLVLANAVYFQGSWLKPFRTENTKIGAFWKDKESCLDTPMMEQTSLFLYHETDTFQILGLPFIGHAHQQNEIAFVILLPKEGEKLPELTGPDFTDLLSYFGPRKVHVKLPKFTLNQKLDLNATLQSMGLKEAFTPHKADLSGIDGKRDLYFSKALHQAFIEVDEAGVTAAAATAIAINLTAAPSPTPPIEFNANHPFLFFIIDLQENIPLFMGKLCAPP